MPRLDDRPVPQPPSGRLLGAVLVGGRSRRMGAAKQLLTHRGSTLAEIAADALAEVADRVVLVGDGPCPTRLCGLVRLADADNVPGPLGGLLAALRWQPGAAWIVAACDLPLLTPAAVRWLADQRHPDRWAILPRLGDRGVEPLLALYEPQARPLLEALACDGRLAPRLIVDHPAVATPEPPPGLRRQWTNINTPEDLHRLDRRQVRRD